MIARVPPPTTASDLERFSAWNPGWRIEREADGSIHMSPTNAETGRRVVLLTLIVGAWNERENAGELFDSSTGFTMPDGSVLSPDLAWIRRDRWLALSASERASYAPIVPDVCVEVVSPSDVLAHIIDKAKRFRQYGATYVLVLDPQSGTTWSEGDAPHEFPVDFRRVVE